VNEKDISKDLPASPTRRRIFQAAGAAGLAASLPGVTAAPASKPAQPAKAISLDDKLQANVKNVVVIYLENRSFNNLFADFPGLASPMSALKPADYQQRDYDGSILPTLPKVWGGLVPVPQDIAGKRYELKEDQLTGLPNAPFKLVDAEGKPLPESVITRDLWHLFYQNQMQINGGKNDGFVAWGNTGGMVMGYYGETEKNLGLWQVARQYTLCDNFFMAAFGGSYLNHQFLISGRCPVYPNAATARQSARLPSCPMARPAIRWPLIQRARNPRWKAGRTTRTMAPSRPTDSRSTPWPRPTSQASYGLRQVETHCTPIRKIQPTCRRKPTTPLVTCSRAKA